MRLIINGQLDELSDGLTVRDLLERNGLDHAPAAVEVNREIVPRRHHHDHVLQDGDQVEIVTLVGGG